MLAWLSVNAAPVDVQGDALLYMHTRERVNVEDRGAMDFAFAENTRRFACGRAASIRVA